MDSVYMNPTETVEARIKNLLSLMTLKEKICQMTQIERSVITPAIKDFTIGTLLLSTFVLLCFLCGADHRPK
jgi:beta-glucosidase